MKVKLNDGKDFKFEDDLVASMEPMFEKDQKFVRMLRINFSKKINNKNYIIITNYYNPNLDGIVKQLLKYLNCI